VTLGENDKGNRTRHTIVNERLEVALLRLEKAMAKNSLDENPADPEKITALISENQELKDTNKAIEDRLNVAIKKLRNIIKEV
jgi:hypothetical protein|tara:strand:- start:123 stop:371 length:249 start_codon:yes stop_codon:yes gene_type:complete